MYDVREDGPLREANGGRHWRGAIRDRRYDVGRGVGRSGEQTKRRG